MQNGERYEVGGEHGAPTSGNFQYSQVLPLRQKPTLSAKEINTATVGVNFQQQNWDSMHNTV